MSKYVNLASKIIDLVHAEHKAGLRAERKKTAEAKAKKIKELDPTVDDENPGFKDKEQEAIKAKSKDEEEDEKEDEDDDPVGKKKEKKDDSKDGEEDKEDGGEDEAPKDSAPPKGPEGGGEAPPEDEGPDPTKQTGREISTGAVDVQKKPSPPMPGNKKSKPKKVEMTGKKEKVDTKPKSESLDDQIRKREERLAKPRFSVEQFKHRIQLKEKFLEIDEQFGIKEQLINEAMWDGKLLPDMELYGKPEITQLQLYRMLELYRAAGMNLEQSCDTIEYLYGVRPVSDEEGNMNFNGTQMDIQKYGRNDGENRASYYK